MHYTNENWLFIYLARGYNVLTILKVDDDTPESKHVALNISSNVLCCVDGRYIVNLQ